MCMLTQIVDVALLNSYAFNRYIICKINKKITAWIIMILSGEGFWKEFK
jgi:hypothetical protein